MTTDELRAAMRELGISQADLAARLGIDVGTLSRMINGHSRIAGYLALTLELIRETKALKAEIGDLRETIDLLSRAHRALDAYAVSGELETRGLV
jgi:transcriptional regulator with XRE-family HTH domain